MTVLTKEDHRRIDELAEKKFTAGRIAQILGRHPSTVQWYMYCNGLSAPKARVYPRMYVRAGVRIHRFTVAEDEFIEEMRLDGFSYGEIAIAAAARFGTERKDHSVRCRLKMLAAREVIE